MSIVTVNLTMNKNKIRKARSFDELLDIKYGKPGTRKRIEFERKADIFIKKEIRSYENKPIL